MGCRSTQDEVRGIVRIARSRYEVRTTDYSFAFTVEDGVDDEHEPRTRTSIPGPTVPWCWWSVNRSAVPAFVLVPFCGDCLDERPGPAETTLRMDDRPESRLERGFFCHCRDGPSIKS